MKQSGLIINDKKTDLCIFHRKSQEKVTIEVHGTMIESANHINILGIIFDSNMTWDQQYDHAAKSASHNLHAICIIAKYFNPEEKNTLLTSLFYSKLYYGSEVWHLPGRSLTQNKKLKFASVNTIRSCDRSISIFETHTHIHKSASQALPDQMIYYKQAITMFKLFQTCQPEQEFVHLNFQLNQNPRIHHANFSSMQNYDSGKNILLNRLAHLNDKIDKSWLDQSINTC